MTTQPSLGDLRGGLELELARAKRSAWNTWPTLSASTFSVTMRLPVIVSSATEHEQPSLHDFASWVGLPRLDRSRVGRHELDSVDGHRPVQGSEPSHSRVSRACLSWERGVRHLKYWIRGRRADN